MRVVVVDGDVSYPMTSGKRLRTTRLLLPLAKDHRITYIARSADPARDDEARQFYGDHGIEPVLVHEPLAQKSGAGFYARLAANIASPLPYAVSSHITPAMRQAALAHAARQSTDVWQLEYLGYLYCVEGIERPVVMQAHNVESLIWRRYGEVESNPLKRAFINLQWRRFLDFERKAFHTVDRVVCVSSADAKLAGEIYGRTGIDVVDNGVDCAGFAGLNPDLNARKLVFLGAFDWRPNLDAVRLLLDSVMPHLRELRPDAVLQLVGRNPPDWLRQRAAGTPGVELHADVPDVRPYLEASALMAVPLRIGGGSRLKILEAMAAGLPVVSTAVGAEGLELEPGRHYELADEPRALAEAIARRLGDPEGSRRMADLGRKLAAERYDWTMLARRLAATWEGAVAGRKRAA